MLCAYWSESFAGEYLKRNLSVCLDSALIMQCAVSARIVCSLVGVRIGIRLLKQ